MAETVILAEGLSKRYGSQPALHGLDLGHLAVLAAIPLVLLGAALWSLNRRDIAA